MLWTVIAIWSYYDMLVVDPVTCLIGRCLPTSSRYQAEAFSNVDSVKQRCRVDGKGLPGDRNKLFALREPAL